ncbi:MAG: diguanylate cyclase [Trueperaceae bacterium]|nr:diguanylate cyclase [Trueperaceae bacterium]
MVLQFGLMLASMAVGLSALGVLAEVRRRGDLLRKPALSGVLVATFLYAFGNGLELAGTTVDWVLATYWIQHLGIAFLPFLLLMLAGDFGWPRVLHATATKAALFGASALTYLVTITNANHDLFHVNPRMVEVDPLTLLAFDRGPWFVGLQIYLAAAVLVANAVFLHAWTRTRGRQRRQARVLLLGSLFPWLGSLASVFGVTPWGIDVSPFVLPVASVLLYQGVVRYGLADIVPIARAHVFENIAEAVIVVDRHGTVVDHNHAANDVLAAAEDPDAATERHVQRYPAIAPLVRHSLLEAGDVTEVEVGERVYGCKAVDLTDRDDEPLGRALVLRDVTRQVHAENRLRHLATTDSLTGIGNRRQFLELARKAVAVSRRSGRPLGWVMFDIDGFKGVNDTHGHATGDLVLQTVAAIATASVREGDILGRLGGDEFALCLPDTDLEGAHALAERVRASVDDVRVAIPEAPEAYARVAVSVGVHVAVGAEIEVEASLAEADDALYQAKDQGGNRVVTSGSSM